MGKKPVATPQTILADLIACKAAFDKVGIPWVIMGGVVLGYARYNEIMAWDTDLDVGVFVEITNKQWKDLRNSFRKKGFRMPDHGADYIHCNRKSSFEVWFWHKNGDCYEAFPATTPGFKFVEKAAWFDEPQTVEFLGDEYPMPNHIEDFLDGHYGKGWKTNVIKDHGQYFREKRGDPQNIASWILNRKRKKDRKLWWPAFLKVDENIGDFNEI
jgi:hypothetical protein